LEEGNLYIAFEVIYTYLVTNYQVYIEYCI